MNFVNRYLYWNMNYHTEHHMFPLVPYHALPRLHEVVKDDMPPAYPSLLAAWREIVPAVLKQARDPTYCVRRRIPAPTAGRADPGTTIGGSTADAEGWVQVCAAADLGPEDVIRFDHDRRAYALCRGAEGRLYATDGMCTHGNTPLSDGLVKGEIIECPKHNGRFNPIGGPTPFAEALRAGSTQPTACVPTAIPRSPTASSRERSSSARSTTAASISPTALRRARPSAARSPPTPSRSAAAAST